MRLLALQSTSVFESYGGIEYYLDDLLTLAVDCGAESVATIVPQRGDGKGWPARPYEVVKVPFGGQRLLRPFENRYSPAVFAAARDAVRRLKPTVILCGHVNLGPLAFAVSRATGVPYVTVAYGIEAWGNLWPQDEWALRQARGIISISHWTKKVLVDRKYDAAKISVVQPMLPREYEKIPAPSRPAPKGGEFRLLTVSRLDAGEAYKGHDHVIEALAKIREKDESLPIRYRIQGDGTDRARLEALVKERKLGDRIEFGAPTRKRSDIESAYRGSDLYVMPSRYGRWDGRWRGEGFGIVYLEAAAFGLPSVAYACGGAMDIIRPNLSGLLLPPDDIETLATELAKLARDPERAFAMGKKAHEIVMQEFTRNAVAKQWRAAAVVR